MTKLIYNNHEINEEEGEDDPLSLSKSKSTFKSIILQIEEHKNKIINMDEGTNTSNNNRIVDNTLEIERKINVSYKNSSSNKTGVNHHKGNLVQVS